MRALFHIYDAVYYGITFTNALNHDWTKRIFEYENASRKVSWWPYQIHVSLLVAQTVAIFYWLIAFTIVQKLMKQKLRYWQLRVKPSLRPTQSTQTSFWNNKLEHILVIKLVNLDYRQNCDSSVLILLIKSKMGFTYLCLNAIYFGGRGGHFMPCSLK